MGERAGLARARPGHDEHRPVRVQDRLTLHGVQPRQQRRADPDSSGALGGWDESTATDVILRWAATGRLRLERLSRALWSVRDLRRGGGCRTCVRRGRPVSGEPQESRRAGALGPLGEPDVRVVAAASLRLRLHAGPPSQGDGGGPGRDGRGPCRVLRDDGQPVEGVALSAVPGAAAALLRSNLVNIFGGLGDRARVWAPGSALAGQRVVGQRGAGRGCLPPGTAGASIDGQLFGPSWVWTAEVTVGACLVVCFLVAGTARRRSRHPVAGDAELGTATIPTRWCRGACWSRRGRRGSRRAPRRRCVRRCGRPSRGEAAPSRRSWRPRW